MTKLFRHTNQRYLEGKCLSVSNSVPRRGPFAEGRTGPVAGGPFNVESDRNILTTTFTYSAGGFVAGSDVTGTAPNMTLTRQAADGGVFTAAMVGRTITIAGTGSGEDGTHVITSYTSPTVIGYYNVNGTGHVGAGAGSWSITTFNAADVGELGVLVRLDANTAPTTAPIPTATGRVNPYNGLTFPIIETIDGETVRLGGGCRFDAPSSVHNLTFTMVAYASCTIQDPVYMHPVATIRADDVPPIANADEFSIRCRGLEWQFRFDSGPVSPGQIKVDLTGITTATQLAAAIVSEINNCVGMTFIARIDPVDDTLVNFFYLPGETEPLVLTANIAAVTTFAVQSTADVLRPWHINQAISFPDAGAAEFEPLGLVPWTITWTSEADPIIADWTGALATMPSTPSRQNTGSVVFAAPNLTLTDAAGLFTPGMVGHFMSISGAVAGNNGVWEIISYTSPTVIVLRAPTGVTEGAGTLDWAMGLRWFTEDRKAWNQDDFFRRILHNSMLDAGYNVIGRVADGVVRCTAGGADGDLFEFWDGAYRAVFELDDDAIVGAGHHAVPIGGAPTAVITATALAAAINAARGAAAFTDAACLPCTLVATRTDEYLDPLGADATLVLRQFEYSREGSGTGTGSLTVPVAGPNPRLVEMTQASVALTSTAALTAVSGTAPEMTVTDITPVTDAMVGQWVTIPAGGSLNDGTFLITAVLSATSFMYLDPAGVAAVDTLGGTWPVMRHAFDASMIGQYITIAGATTVGNNGKFLITSVPSSEVVRYRNETGAAEAFSGTWESKARQADVNEPVTGVLVDFEYSGMAGGQHPGQMRGLNGPFTTTYGLQQDWVYFSAGESSDLASRYFRRTWIRAIANCAGASSVVSLDNSRRGFDWAVWQSWDPWFNNGVGELGSNVYAPGNGSQPVRAPHARNGNLHAATATTVYTTSGGLAWGSVNDKGNTVFGDTSAHIMNYNNVLGIQGGDPWELDYVIFGDKDELHVYGLSTGAGGAYIGLFNVLEKDQNPHKFLLRSAVTAGANKQLNIGPYNPQTLSPPLIVGDRIQLYGQGLAVDGVFVSPTFPSGGAFVESTSILNFGVVDPTVAVPDYYIEVAALAEAYAVGTVVGEEAGTAGINQGLDSFGVITGFIMQNSSNFGEATYHDYAGLATAGGAVRGYGFPGTPMSLATSMEQFDPNERSARWGLIPALLNMSQDGEFRGSLRYIWLAPIRAGGNSYVRTPTGEVYYLAQAFYAQTFALMGFGPMTSEIAGLL